jgi:CubicO group peptidase (beta-lactamase class C family)
LTFDTLKTKQEAANAGLPNQQLIKAIRYTDQLYLFNPSWIKSLEQILKPKVNGYAAKVFFGNITVGAQYGAARVQVDSPNKPPLPFTMKTRLNLASVSKPITAVVILKILEDKKISVDAPFYAQANVQKQFPSVGPGVDKVTIRNLLQHRSGMSVNNQLMFGETPGTSGSIFTFLGKYLKEQNVTENKRGILQAYSNTNYTIIQALISCITTVTDPKDPAFTNNGQVNDHYWQYVAQNFLRPWGIDTSSFNPIPDARDTAALSYGKLPSVHPGVYWEQGDGVAAGSWIASANDLSSFLTFTRNGQYVNDIGGMLGNNLGWWKYEGIYGQYFFHNGGIGSTATATGEKYGLSTSMIIFPGRIGAVILANGENVGAFEALVEAFEVNVPKLAG